MNSESKIKSKVLSEIWIYPIKSLPGIQLPKALVAPKGLQFDRRWMLVDQNSRFLTQRVHPEMALFNVKLENEFLIVSKKSLKQEIAIPNTIAINLISTSYEKTLKVQIWQNEVEAIEVKKSFSVWFSEQLQFKCRLVFFPENNRRDVDPDFATIGDQVSFADAYPILIIGQTSLENLNQKLESPITSMRFRPNFIFSGDLPHAEDNWKNFTIGAVSFEGVKPCSRCVVITLNPDNGEKGVEPLKTLAKFRTQNGKVHFGENVIPRSTGEVKIGDRIEIIDLKSNQ